MFTSLCSNIYIYALSPCFCLLIFFLLLFLFPLHFFLLLFEKFGAFLYVFFLCYGFYADYIYFSVLLSLHFQLHFLKINKQHEKMEKNGLFSSAPCFSFMIFYVFKHNHVQFCIYCYAFKHTILYCFFF